MERTARTEGKVQSRFKGVSRSTVLTSFRARQQGAFKIQAVSNPRKRLGSLIRATCFNWLVLEVNS